MSERGVIAIKFGGEMRRLRVELGAAPEIEERTGKSIMQLAADLSATRAKVKEIHAVFKSILDANGEKFTDEEVFSAMGDLGYESSMVAALKLLTAFFVAPKEGASAKKSQAKS